jgi:hypothetical protein
VNSSTETRNNAASKPAASRTPGSPGVVIEPEGELTPVERFAAETAKELDLGQRPVDVRCRRGCCCTPREQTPEGRSERRREPFLWAQPISTPWENRAGRGVWVWWPGLSQPCRARRHRHPLAPSTWLPECQSRSWCQSGGFRDVPCARHR